MSMATSIRPAQSLAHRVLAAAVGAGIMTAGAFGMHASVPVVAAWLACHTGAEVVEGVAVLPRLELVAALALTVVAANVAMVLGAWVVLRHVKATRRPLGVTFVFVVWLGCYVWGPRLDGEGGSGWMLLASSSMPVAAALAGLLEALLRRLPRRELGTAALLLAATLAHQLAWWGLWSS